MLNIVTISGADNEVDPDQLVRLSLRFPFVEWGILLSSSRAGSARYPTPDWVWELARAVGRRPVKLSAHLCGQMARDTLMGNSEVLDGLPPSFARVQLNGYETLRNGFFAAAKKHPEIEFIMQARTPEQLKQAVADELFANAGDLRVRTLIDPSGGKGESGSTLWKEHESLDCESYVGFAGGITPANVIETIESCVGAADNFWIDMESGVRSGGTPTPRGDTFDLALVEEVLEKAKPFVWKGKQ